MYFFTEKGFCTEQMVMGRCFLHGVLGINAICFIYANIKFNLLYCLNNVFSELNFWYNIILEYYKWRKLIDKTKYNQLLIPSIKVVKV